MKSRQTLVAALCVCIILIVLALIVNNMEQTKQKPEERNTTEAAFVQDSSENVVDEITEDTASDVSTSNDITSESMDIGDNSKSWRDKTGDCTIQYDGLRIDFMSCDVIEDIDIETQTKYPAENFRSGTLPDGDFIETRTDWEAVFAEAPEYEKAYYSNDVSEEGLAEFYAIKEKYQDVIDKYTTEGHPKTKYYFVKCKITNEASASIESSLYLMGLQAFEGQMVPWEGCVYFDSSIHTTEGDDRDSWFFLRSIEAGETLECTLGFEAIQYFSEDETLYIGDVPEWSDSSYNPDTLPNLVKLDNIPREQG